MTCCRCKKSIIDGTRIYMKCPGIYEEVTPGIWRAIPENVEDFWHATCDDEESE